MSGTKKKQEDENILGEMPVRTLFVKLAVPAVLGQLINVLYNLVDRMFIGHIPQTGSQALAGVGVTAPVILSAAMTAVMLLCGRKILLLFGASSDTIEYLQYRNYFCAADTWTECIYQCTGMC